MSEPTVSVVIPCYNYGHYINTCVESAIRQEGVDVDVVIVDDASTDGTSDVVDELARRHQRVTVIHHAENQGHIATFNDCLDAVVGEYAVLISADDCLAPNALVRSIPAFERDERVGMVVGSRVDFAHDDELPFGAAFSSWTPPVGDDHIHVNDGRRWVRERCRQGINPIISPEVVVRSSVQRRVGHFIATCPHTSDFNMWLRIAAVSDVAYVRGAPFAYYRRHGLSLSQTKYNSQLVDLKERLIAFEHVTESEELDDATRNEWARSSRRALASEALFAARRLFEQSPDDSAEVVDELATFARELDPVMARRATDVGPAGTTIKRQRVGRAVKRLSWRYWFWRWYQKGI